MAEGVSLFLALYAFFESLRMGIPPLLVARRLRMLLLRFLLEAWILWAARMESLILLRKP